MATAGQVIRCRAAVAWEPRRPLSVIEVDVAPPKAHEVRIKASKHCSTLSHCFRSFSLSVTGSACISVSAPQVVASGVCHTDWEYLYEAGKGTVLRRFPLVLGHEAAGIVESVGPEVTEFCPGDKVIPLFLPYCRKCLRCRSSTTNLCKTNWENTQSGVLADGTSRISCKGQQVFQFLGVSSFCQYTVVPDTSVTKIRSDAPLDKVCLLGCGVSTGYGAALNTGQVQHGSSCVVFGLGVVGLAAIMGCKAAGARRIIGVDINPDKFEKAKEFGATECINPGRYSKPIQEVLLEMTGGGADYALECVGSPAVMSAALESTTEVGGTCVIAGWAETESMKVPVIKLLMGRTLKGTYFGGWRSVHDVPRLVDDYMNRKLQLDEFITHQLSLDHINEAFELLKHGQSIRTVISLQDSEEDKPHF